MFFMFKSDNSADLYWDSVGASGTIHIPDVRKFLNTLELARRTFDALQELKEKSSCGDS